MLVAFYCAVYLGVIAWLYRDLGLFSALCGLYDGIGAVGVRVYAGRFTLLKSDYFSQKAIVVLRTCHSASGTYRTIKHRGRGVVSIPKIKSHI